MTKVEINKDKYVNVMKYIWCKNFKLTDFPQCCKNCKTHECDENNNKTG